MSWTPIPEAELLDLIKKAETQMDAPQKALWEKIQVSPRKWKEAEYGNQGGGFWAVAIIGATVIWYNDIEEGFNRSPYTDFGTIDEYGCEQDELQWVVQHVLNEMK